jgi:hypothetical protein
MAGDSVPFPWLRGAAAGAPKFGWRPPMVRRRLLLVASITWGPEIAEVYDTAYAAQSATPVLGLITGLLAELARGGPVLEFVANTIMNVTTQDDQLAVFANAAAHLQAGGCFVVEVEVPQLRRVPPGETGRVFTLDTDHLGIETFDDTAAQVAWSHHWIQVEERLVRHSAPYRYVWPSELDLMAKITGFRVRDRWAGWDQAPFTSASQSQVAVFEKLPPPPALTEALDLRG